MKKSISVAIIDDEPNIRNAIRLCLESVGFEVSTFQNAEDALDVLIARPVDVLLIDIELKAVSNGIDLLRKLRARRIQSAAIFVSSMVEDIHQTYAFENGADDFIKKPFSTDRLIQRIHTVYKRCTAIATQSGEFDTYLGDLKLASGAFKCHWKEVPVPLNASEFAVVAALVERPDLAKTKEQLAKTVSDELVKDLGGLVSRARKKFREVDPTFDSIEPVYGVGYRWRSNDD